MRPNTAILIELLLTGPCNAPSVNRPAELPKLVAQSSWISTVIQAGETSFSVACSGLSPSDMNIAAMITSAYLTSTTDISEKRRGMSAWHTSIRRATLAMPSRARISADPSSAFQCTQSRPTVSYSKDFPGPRTKFDIVELRVCFHRVEARRLCDGFWRFLRLLTRARHDGRKFLAAHAPRKPPGDGAPVGPQPYAGRPPAR